MYEKSIIKQPLPRAPSCQGWMGRLAVAVVTPVPSVPPCQHGMHQLHTLITSPITTLNLSWGVTSHVPLGLITSSHQSSLALQEVKPRAMLSFPSQCIQLNFQSSACSCFPLYTLQMCCLFSHPKEGIWAVWYLGGGCCRGTVPAWWHQHPSKLKLTPGQVWSFAVCLSDLFMEQLCKIHTHLLLLWSPSSNSRNPWVLSCALYPALIQGKHPHNPHPQGGARRRRLGKH